MAPEQASTGQDELDAKKEQLRRVAEFVRHSIGWAYVGINGELICGWRGEGPPDEALYVMRTDNGLELFEAWPPRQEPYAKVEEDGTVHLTSPEKDASALPCFPKRWPRESAKARFQMPPAWSVITHAEYSKMRPRPPHDCLGWGFLLQNGQLMVPPKEVKAFPNVIWAVRREDGGINLVHSGPLKEGLYATVFPDFSVRLEEPIPLEKPGPSGKGGVDASSETELCWPVVDSEGRPGFPNGKHRYVFSPTLKGMRGEVEVDKYGNIFSLRGSHFYK